MATYPHVRDGYIEFDSSGFPYFGDDSRTVLDDFEDQSLSEYGSSTSGWRITGSSVLEGRHSLESTAQEQTLGNGGNTIPTPRTVDPTEYRARVMLEDSGQAGLITNAQSTSYPWANCYCAIVQTGNNRFRLIKRVGNSTTDIENLTVSGGLDTNTLYQPAITLTDVGIKGTLYDSTGGKISETDSYRETDHTGGGLGWFNGNGQTAYFDYATRGDGAIGDVGLRIIDSFEDRNLNPYWMYDSSEVGTTTASAFDGNYGLVLHGFTEAQTVPGAGLENYPRDGETFRVYTQFRNKGSNQYWLTLCPQSRNSQSNRYRLEFLMTGGMRLRKTQSGSTNTLSGQSDSDASFAESYAFNYVEDVWYYVDITLDGSSGGGMRAELRRANGNLVSWVETDERAWIENENGFGFRSSGGGRVWFDHLHEPEQ